MEGWKFWWGIAAFFLGGLATQLNGWLTYRRQRQDKAEEAEDALRQRREEFELAHLVDFNHLLVDAMEKLLDYNGAVRQHLHLQELGSVDDETEQWRSRAEEASHAALTSLVMQVGFILADDVRRLANATGDRIASANAQLHAGNPLNVAELADEAEALHEGVAARVREIYAGQGAVSQAGAHRGATRG